MVVSPFSEEVEEEEHRQPQRLNPVSLGHAATVLRSKLRAWSFLTRRARPRNIGSFSVELTMIRMPDGRTVNIAATPPEAKALLDAAYRHLCRLVTPDVAQVLSTTLVKNTRALNSLAFELLNRGAKSHSCNTVTVRGVIKDLTTLQVSMKNTAVWFPTAHTNAIVLDTHTKTLAVLEPSLAECLPGVVNTAARLAPSGYALLQTRADQEAPIADLVMCTVGAAVQALVFIFNPVDTQEELTMLVNWIHAHQHWLIRLLVRTVGGLGPTPPRPATADLLPVILEE